MDTTTTTTAGTLHAYADHPTHRYTRACVSVSSRFHKTNKQTQTSNTMDKVANEIILEFLQRCSEPVVQGMLTKGGGKFWFTPSSHPEVESILTTFCQHPTWPFRTTSVQHGAVLTEVALQPPSSDWLEPMLVRIDLAAHQLFNLGEVDVLYAVKTNGGRPSVLVNSTDRVHYLSSEVFDRPIVTGQIRYTTLSFDKPVTLYACKTSLRDKTKDAPLLTIRMFGVQWSVHSNGYIVPALTGPAAVQYKPPVLDLVSILVPEEKWEVVSETPETTAVPAVTPTPTATDAQPETKTGTVTVATTAPTTPIVAPTTEAEKLRLWYTMGIAMMDLRDEDTVFVVSGAPQEATVLKATLVGDIQWSKQFHATFTVRLVDAPTLSVTLEGSAGYPVGRPLLLPVSTRADATTLVESRGLKVSDTAWLMSGVVVDRTSQQEQELALGDVEPLTLLEKWRVWAVATVNLFHLDKGYTVFVRAGDSDGPWVLLEALVEHRPEWNPQRKEDDYLTGWITVRLVETPCVTVRMQFIADYSKHECPRIFPYNCRGAALRLAKSRNLVLGPKAAFKFPGDSVVSVTPTQV